MNRGGPDSGTSQSWLENPTRNSAASWTAWASTSRRLVSSPRVVCTIRDAPVQRPAGSFEGCGRDDASGSDYSKVLSDLDSLLGDERSSAEVSRGQQIGSQWSRVHRLRLAIGTDERSGCERLDDGIVPQRQFDLDGIRGHNRGRYCYSEPGRSGQLVDAVLRGLQRINCGEPPAVPLACDGCDEPYPCPE